MIVKHIEITTNSPILAKLEKISWHSLCAGFASIVNSTTLKSLDRTSAGHTCRQSRDI